MILRFLVRAIGAELIKLKRTLALKMALIAPAIVVMPLFLGIHHRANEFAKQGDVWHPLTQNIFMLWIVLMLPLFVTLETALLGGLEHAEKNWKHLFAMPILRGAIYAAKLVTNILLTGLSTFAVFAGTFIAGFALKALKPQLHFASPAPWAHTLRLYVFSFFAAWLMIAIQTWVSARWQSFSVAIGVGIAATVVGFVLINAHIWERVYPWTLTINFVAQNGSPALGLSLGVVGGLAAAIAGGVEFTRRDVS